ncbi:heparinase II/III family protein [[Empedobacter] haloabium]|uniref:Heparinase II/III family protein n=1 Tax=[Empedobacter] haloabium TaxID=592317 RepID=A0ABZ1UTV0_9BURK
MKYLWPVAALLCVDPAHADILTGDYIQRPDQPLCNPYALGQTDNTWLDFAIPRHCAVVTVSNPVFAWTRKKYLPTDRQTATFELRDASDTVIYTATTEDSRLILPPDVHLTSYTDDPNAVYRWTVSYTAWNRIYKSAPRQFTVEKVMVNDKPYAVPTEDEIVTKAKMRAHPRAVKRTSNGQIYDLLNNQIRGGARKSELTAAYVATKRAMWALGEKYIPTPEHTSSVLAQGVGNERQAIETLGHLYFLMRNSTGEQESALTFLKKCKSRLVSLAGWAHDATAPTHQGNNDQANREAFLALALGWDIFQSPEVKGLDAEYRLSDQELDDIRALAMERINLAIEGAGQKAGFKALQTSPFNSHVISATHYVTEALMYLVRPEDTVSDLRDAKDAASLLAKSWRTLVTSVGTWGGNSDGGFGNGSNYAWYSMEKNARTLAAVKLITGADLTHFTPIGGIGSNIIAQTPPAQVNTAQVHKQMGSFGDGAEINDHFQDYGGTDFRLLAYATQKPVYEWYWRTLPSFVTTGMALTPYSFLLFGPGPAPVAPAPTQEHPVPDSFLFEDAGYVAFHSKTTDPNRTSLYFRSSPQGAASHAEADNNAFVFVSQGEDVLINSGFYGAWEDEHFRKWTRHTMSKNALTMTFGYGTASERTGFGQAQHYKDGKFDSTIYESSEPSGKIVNYHAGTGNDRWRIATGDATAAYRFYDAASTTWRPLLDSAIRTVAYLKGASGTNQGVVLVYDYAVSQEPRTWELNFHTLKAPVIGENRLTITTPKRDNSGSIETKLTYFGSAKMEVSSITQVYDDNSKTYVSIPAPMSTKYVKQPWQTQQWHTRFTQDGSSKEFYALTVIEEGGNPAVNVTLNGSAEIKASVGTQWITFNRGKVEFSPN